MVDINPWGTNVTPGGAQFGKRVNLGPVDNLTSGVSGSVLILTSTGAFGVSGLTGPTGLQGIQGQTGAGLQGVTGLQGITGISIAGTTGFQGDTGLIGVTGLILQGASGILGSEGITGVSIGSNTGIAGYTGQIGSTGSVGLTGDTGVQGLTGAILQGSPGLVGVTGFLGVTGFIGATGVAQQGNTGFQGITGLAGVTGIFSYQNLDTQQQAAGSTGFYLVPANTLSANAQQLEFTAWGLTASGTATSINVVFDGFTVFSQSVNVAGGATFMLRGWIIRVASTVEEITVECVFDKQVVCAVQRFPAVVSLVDPQNLVVYVESLGAGHVVNGLIVNRAT